MTSFPLRSALALAVASASVFALGACSAQSDASADDETYNLIFSHVAAETSPEGLAAEKLKELLEAETDGRITVEVYANGALYSQNDQMQALQSNSVQMIAASGANFTTIAPQLQVLSLPFLLDSPAELPAVVAHGTPVGDAIYENEDLASKDLKVMSIWSAGMKQLGDNKEIRVPADMAGRSYRIQSSDVLAAQFEAWGASPSVMSFAEVYTGLEQGLIDGQENTYANMFGQSMNNVQSSITESNHGLLDQIVAINLSFYESLPDDLRETLDEVMVEVAEFNYESSDQTNEEAKQGIIDAGTSEIVTLTDDERAQWIDAVVPSVWTKFEDVIGAEVIAALLDDRE